MSPEENIKLVRSKISELEKQLRGLYGELHEAQRTCKHEFITIPDDKLEEWKEEGVLEWKYESTKCVKCDTKVRGWRCHSSPDDVCHYHSSSGKQVELTNGSMFDLPEDYDPKYETYDSCIFCGDPEERK